MAADDSTRALAIKARVLDLLQKGLVSQSEAAKLADTSRQRVRGWCQQAEIDPTTARERYLKSLWKGTKA
jgi:DNA-binding transcriptional regulator YiaG